MYCRNCGMQILEKSTYCKYCGEKVNSRFGKNKKKKCIIGIGSIVLIISIVSILNVYMYKKNFEKKMKDLIDMAWNEDDDMPAFLKKISALSSYEIIEIERTDIYTVYVKVRGIDLGNEIDDFLKEYTTEEMNEGVLNEHLINLIEQCDVVETRASIYIEQLESEYSVYFSDTFVDAMSGKIYSFFLDSLKKSLGT